MSKIHGETILTFPDGSERRLPNQKIFELAANLTSDAAGPTLAMFKECVSARSTDGSRLYEMIFAYINGPAPTTEAKPS
jgi:hypothetical protein